MKYDLAVFIGRFQPYHNGHDHVVKRALSKAKNLVVLIGGADGARRPRNPWTFFERTKMLPTDSRIYKMPLRDHLYRDELWVKEVQERVGNVAERLEAKSVALIGQHKDESGYYLKLFPQWDSIPVVDGPKLNATDIRNQMFRDGVLENCPENSTNFLVEYMHSDEFKRMQGEWHYINRYKQSHDSGQFHRNNITADAVVVQSGHVLLIRRKSEPGKGKLALPGGHVGRLELPSDAAIRELREETGIKVPEPVLRGQIVAERWFDDPYRSDLCRTYTKASLIRLKDDVRLPKVKGGDDAAEALWVPLSEVREQDLFDDHYHIISNLIGG